MEMIENEKALRNFWNKVDKTESCWNWTGSCVRKGYGHFNINNRNKFAHRVSFEIHNKRLIGAGMFIMHSCDNPKCVNPSHLSEGTHQDNINDKVNKNRQSKGALHGRSKLSEEQVLEIREKYSKGDVLKKHLGLEYNIDSSAIGKIINRKNWKHL